MSIKRRLERLEIRTKATDGVVIYELKKDIVIRTRGGRITTLTIREYQRDQREALVTGYTVIIDDVLGGAA